MKRFLPFAALAALALALAYCRATIPATSPVPPTVQPVRLAGNISADSCEVTAGWADGSVILRLTQPGAIGEIVLVIGDETLRCRAHAYWEGPGICYGEWGLDADYIRLFANGHAEGRHKGKAFYFTPVGSGECLPER